MRSEVFKDYATKSTGVQFRISDHELALALAPREFIETVRNEIAAKIADHLMVRLRPAIDKAIAEEFGVTS